MAIRAIKETIDMSDERMSPAANLSALKEKLFEEFEKMAQTLQEEKSNFEQQMARRKSELDSELKNRLAELAAERKEVDEAKSQLQQKGAYYAQEIEKKTQALERMKNEIEEEKRAYLQKIKEEQGRSQSEEARKIGDVEAMSRQTEKENRELLKQKTIIENALKNLKLTHRKEEELHFQKMAAFKNKLEELEDEIEHKLFFTADPANPDHVKKSRQLIIKTITGDTYRGNINIGSKERLSDMFTKVKTPFIVMYDVISKGETKATVIINKQNIVSIKPLDSPAGDFATDDTAEDQA